MKVSYKNKWVLVLCITVTLIACHAGTSANHQSNQKSITTYSLLSANGPVNGLINNNNISVTIPNGTDVTKLVASFTTTGSSVKVGNVLQISGKTPNNFSNPVVYTVTAANKTTQNYTVTVTTNKADNRSITAYSLDGIAGKIYESNIFVELSSGTNLDSLVATFTTTGSSVKIGNNLQKSGETPNNFSNPVIYTVTAEDGEQRNYKVTVSDPLFVCIKDDVTDNACGCLLQNDDSGLIWYVGENIVDTWTNWCSHVGIAKDPNCKKDGTSLSLFNQNKHCGYNNWHLPTGKILSEAITVDRVGGDWGKLGAYAKQFGWKYEPDSFKFFTWLNNHHLTNLQHYPYWTSVSDVDFAYINAWNIAPSGQIFEARVFGTAGVILVRSSK